MTMRSIRRAIFAVPLTALCTLAFLTVPPTATANSDSYSVVPDERVTLDVLTVNGSGCPAGTASVYPQADNTGFSIAYTDYVASANGSAAPTDFRKNCQIAVRVHTPQGFTFAVSRTDFRGYARLSSSASALQRATYYFQGQPDSQVRDHTVSGPLYGRWHTSDVIADASLVHSACGVDQVLNINTELRVDEGTSASPQWISMTRTSTDVATLVHFSWKRC